MTTSSLRQGVTLRAVTDADAPAVLRLNLDHVELLAPMEQERFGQLRGLADRFDVVEVAGRFAGFVVTFAPDSAYDSENYRWFSARYERFYYLDRIVLEPALRRRGVGGAVYDEVEQRAAAYGRMTLEVNVAPPNQPSLAFHAGRGYVVVGRLGDPDHQVALMTKALPAGLSPVAGA